MKAIIARKRYDTETATKVAEWWNGVYYEDFGFCKETLYLTSRQAWFLHGEGGASSSYGRFVGGGFVRGEAIRPLTPNEVRQWCEQHQKVYVLEEFFADTTEDA